MDYNEALERLENHAQYYLNNEDLQALDIAKEALRYIIEHNIDLEYI